jgi:hypothetical protein
MAAMFAPAALAISAEDRAPQRQHRVALGLQRGRLDLGGRFVQPRLVLHAAQFAVGVGGGLAHARGQQAGRFGALQQRDVAQVGHQRRVRAPTATAPGTAPRTRHPPCRRGCA